MTVLAVIPARLGATRLPRKPLRLLGGVPMIVRVARRVHELGVAERVVIATDSPEVLDICERAGLSATLTRVDHPSGTDRVAEVLSQPAFADAQVVLNVQGDEPFVSRDAVSGALEMVTSGRFPLGTVAAAAAAEVLARPDVVKVVCANDGRALYFSRAAIPYLRDAADTESRDQLVRQHIGVYAYTRDALHEWVALRPHPLELVERLEQLRPLAHGMAIGVAFVASSGHAGIDTEEDLLRAEQLLLHMNDHTSAGIVSAAHSPLSSTL